MSEFLRGSLAIFLLIIASMMFFATADSKSTAHPPVNVDSKSKLSDKASSSDGTCEIDVNAVATGRTGAPSTGTTGANLARSLSITDSNEDLAANHSANTSVGSNGGSPSTASRLAATKSATVNDDDLVNDDLAAKPKSGWLLWLLKLALFLFLLVWLLRWLYRVCTEGNANTMAHASDNETDQMDDRMDAELGRVFVTRPDRIDDLTQVKGIDAAAASRLNTAGIYQLEQLKDMSDAQRSALQGKLNLPNLKWDSLTASPNNHSNRAGGGLAKTAAATTAAAIGGTAAIAAAGAGLAASAKTNNKQSVAKPPANQSKQTTTDTQSLPTEPSVSLTPDFLAKAKRNWSGAGSKSTDASHTNLTAKTVTNSAKTSPAAALSPDFLAKAKTAWGTTPPAPNAPTSNENNGDLPTTRKGHGTKDHPEFGHIYLIPPQQRDDLTQLDGIDKDTAAAMNQAGIYRFDQINNMSDEQQTAVKRRFKLPSIDFGKWKRTIPGLVTGAATLGSIGAVAPQFTQTGSAKADTDSPHAKKSNLEPKVTSANDDAQSPITTKWDASTRIDLDFGEVFVHPPKDKNDLTQLPGIDKSVAAKMNAAGIYRFDQLRSLSPRQQASFKRRFGIPFGDWGGLVGSRRDGTNVPAKDYRTAGQGSGRSISGTAPGLARTSSSASPIGFSAQGSSSEASGATAGMRRDPRTRDTAKIDRELGFLYTSHPADSDDLSRLAGIDQETEARLNAAGIYKFDQLKSLNDEQQSLLADRFQLGNVDFSDWQRCMYAWGRGINTSANAEQTYGSGKIHGVALPQIAPGIFDGEQLIAYPEQVIFRGSNPEGWGKKHDQAIEGVSTSLSSDAIRSDINYLRVRRIDTRESVVLPISKGQLFANGDPAETGWNGSSELFYGGRHIGAFAKNLPQEVETKFSQGGWGFGHRYDHNDRQEWGWAGRVIEPTTFEVSVGRIGEVPGTVVFRSADPTIWNTQTRDGEFRTANPLSSVVHPVHFVRIMRDTTGEAVIVRVDGNHLLSEGFDARCGWNGSGSHFSGGNHLGVYHSELPQDFETRFGFGGWGFGHPYDDNDRQAWGWAGRQLPETVFEISLLESVPDFLRHEVIE